MQGFYGMITSYFSFGQVQSREPLGWKQLRGFLFAKRAPGGALVDLPGEFFISVLILLQQPGRSCKDIGIISNNQTLYISENVTKFIVGHFVQKVDDALFSIHEKHLLVKTAYKYQNKSLCVPVRVRYRINSVPSIS